MIKTIEINNFRCFKHLKIDKCRRFNIVVGDNGSGKTALLEAVLLALGSSPSLTIRYRQQRGLEGSFAGPLRDIQKEIWQDYFFNNDWSQAITINLSGDGPEARSVHVSRRPSQTSLPISPDSGTGEQGSAPIAFRWRAVDGKEYECIPKFAKDSIHFPDTGEDLPTYYMFGANHPVNSIETAQRFSALDKQEESKKFITRITKEFEWISDITVQTLAGTPALFARVVGQKNQIPLANVSSGINRWAGIMLGAYSAIESVVLVDEIENGLYYGHHANLWRGLIDAAYDAQSQLIVTTHSHEWLAALTDAVEEDFDDIALWRIERGESGPILQQFAGKKVLDAIAAGEVR